MTLRTYIDRAIHDGTDFDAVISGCDVQEICTDRLFLGDAFSRCTAGYCSPREYRRLFRAG